MANYYRVSPKFWLWARRRNLTDAQTTLAFYLLTCEHRNLEGLYRLPKQYVAADLAWTPENVDENLQVLLDAGFAMYDEDAQMVLIPKALKHQAPSTERQVMGAINQLERIPRTSLWNAFRMACESHCQCLSDAIEMRWPSDSNTRARASSSSSSSSSSKEAATPQRSRAEKSVSGALGVACPRCGVPAGTKCDGARGKRDSCHLERHHAVGELTHLAAGASRRGGTLSHLRPSAAAMEAHRRRQAEEAEMATLFPGVDPVFVRRAARRLVDEGREASVDAIRSALAEHAA